MLPLNIFLEFHFDLSVVFFGVPLCIDFLVLALKSHIYITYAQSTSVNILPFCNSVTGSWGSLHFFQSTPLCSVWVV